MADNITVEDLERIEAYIAKARPEPWERETRNANHRDLVGNVLLSAEGKSIADSINSDYIATNYDADEDGVNYFDEGTFDDFEFCANARTDLPRLVAAHRELLDRLATVERERTKWAHNALVNADKQARISTWERAIELVKAVPFHMAKSSYSLALEALEAAKNEEESG